jgi:hypothetical protein
MRPLHPQEAVGVSLRYAMTTDHPWIEGRDGWNLKAWHNTRPLAGYVLPAHRLGTMVIGVSEKQCGHHHVRGFIVDYRIGAIRFSAPQQFGLELSPRHRRLCGTGAG